MIRGADAGLPDRRWRLDPAGWNAAKAPAAV
jgi:hypothetical protein